jgi:hypothetical protein
MDRPRLICALRIAWSVWWGIVCVLLEVLWVRSYYAYDGVTGPLPGSGFLIMSRSGGLGVAIHREEWDFGWSLVAVRPQEVKLPYHTALGFVEYMADAQVYRVRLPFWCLILISVAFVAVPWMRFSLRTLLIATTLIAVGLGLAVWSSN